MVCTASPKFIADNADRLPDDSSRFADEGTRAHDLAEKILLGEDYMGPPDMVEHVKGYASRVKANLACAGEDAKLHIETKVPLFYMPDRNGRIDSTIVDRKNVEMTVRDLKYGEGHMVEAEGNMQLAIYGESMIQSEWPDMPANGTVRIIIDQPRARDGDTVKSWELSRGELGVFAARIGAVARKVLANEDTQFSPGEDACRFCPAKGICTAKGKEALDVLPEEAIMELGGLPAPEGLSESQILRIVHAKKQLENWLQGIEDHVFAQLQAGKTVEGFKLVKGRANKIWVDEALAAKRLAPLIGKAHCWSTQKIITPTQAEKLLKKPLKPVTATVAKRIEDLILRPEGKPVLAFESDTRPASDPNQNAGFIDETLL